MYEGRGGRESIMACTTQRRRLIHWKSKTVSVPSLVRRTCMLLAYRSCGSKVIRCAEGGRSLGMRLVRPAPPARLGAPGRGKTARIDCLRMRGIFRLFSGYFLVYSMNIITTHVTPPWRAPGRAGRPRIIYIILAVKKHRCLAL